MLRIGDTGGGTTVEALGAWRSSSPVQITFKRIGGADGLRTWENVPHRRRVPVAPARYARPVRLGSRICWSRMCFLPIGAASARLVMPTKRLLSRKVLAQLLPFPRTSHDEG